MYSTGRPTHWALYFSPTMFVWGGLPGHQPAQQSALQQAYNILTDQEKLGLLNEAFRCPV